MKKLGIGCAVLAVLAFIVLVIVAIAGGSYNRLVTLSQNVDSKWAQVQNDYQRRADLIPNLVQTVSGAANFEKSTLTEITQARASVGQVKIDPNAAQRPAKAGRLPARPGPALRRIVAPAGGVRALSRPQGQRQFPGLASPVGGDRKPHRGRPHGFQ